MIGIEICQSFRFIDMLFMFSLCHHSLPKDASKFEMQVDEDEIYWRHRKEDEELEWTPNSTHLISQLTQCFSEYFFFLHLFLFLHIFTSLHRSIC